MEAYKQEFIDFLLFCILLHNNQNYVVFFGNFKQALN